MSTGPRFRRRVDANHAEIRQLFRGCGCTVLDTSNLGGKVGDLIIQYRDTSTRNYTLMTHLIETKANVKKKLTDSQIGNPLKLIRIDCRADVFSLLNKKDWEAE